MRRALVDSYPHRRAGHCGSGALRDLMEHHGLSYGDEPPSEGMVFGLAGGFGFYYFELPEGEPPIYLVGRTRDLERDFCRHLGVELDLRETDDSEEGWRWLRAALERGRPTMVWADIKHLDYLRVRMHNTMHDVVITGYDEDEGVAYVADNDRDEIQRCSLESLAVARNSTAFPGPNRHATWLMEFPDELPPLELAIDRALRRSIKNMRQGGSALADLPGGAGLAGVESFAAGYARWPERFEHRLGLALRALRVFIVKAGTGGAMFRSLHARFLADAAELLTDRVLSEAASVYRELASAWVVLAEATVVEGPREAHAAGRAAVGRIVELEREGIALMEAWTCARVAT